MVGIDLEVGAKEVETPLLQRMDNSEEFLLVRRIVFLCSLELPRLTLGARPTVFGRKLVISLTAV